MAHKEVIITFREGPPHARVGTDGLHVTISAAAMGMYLIPRFEEEDWKVIGSEVNRLLDELEKEKSDGV